METGNLVNKKKLNSRFGFFYILSIVLLALIFSGLWNMYYQSNAISSNITRSGDNADANEILKQDELLHAGLKRLQQLDDSYALFVIDAADSHRLDSLNRVIENIETALSNSIDSIAHEKKTFNNVLNMVKRDSLVSAFKLALNSRTSLGYIRTALSGSNSNFSEDQRRLLQLKLDVENKNKRIVALEKQLMAQQSAKVTAAPPEPKSRANQENEVLREQNKMHEELISRLQAANTSLTKSNSRLTQQVADVRSSISLNEGQSKTDQKKTDNLENKIIDLEAELEFAKIDCNLSRADAKQIISNSKQRKQLLQESLNSLSNLSHSSNLSTQRTAKEKLSRLQSIVATIRD